MSDAADTFMAIVLILLAIIGFWGSIGTFISSTFFYEWHNDSMQVLEVKGDDFDQYLTVLCGTDVYHCVKCCRNIDVHVGDKVNVSYKSAFMASMYDLEVRC